MEDYARQSWQRSSRTLDHAQSRSTTSLQLINYTHDHGIVARKAAVPSSKYNYNDQSHNSDHGGQVGNNHTDRRSWEYIVNSNNNERTAPPKDGRRLRPSLVLAEDPPEGVVTVELVKGATGFGFGLTETRDGHVVKHISDPARCSRVKVKDRIVSLDGVSVGHLAHADVVAILREKPIDSVTKITFFRDIPSNERVNRIMTTHPVEKSPGTQPAVHGTNISPNRSSAPANGIVYHPSYEEKSISMVSSSNTSSLTRARNLVTITVPLHSYPLSESVDKTKYNADSNTSYFQPNVAVVDYSQKTSTHQKDKGPRPQSYSFSLVNDKNVRPQSANISVANDKSVRPQSSISVAHDNSNRPQSSLSSVFFSGTPDFVPASAYQSLNFRRTKTTDRSATAVTVQDTQTLDKRTSQSHILRKPPKGQQTVRPKSAFIERTVVVDSQPEHEKRISNTAATGITFYPKHKVQSPVVTTTVDPSSLADGNIDPVLSNKIKSQKSSPDGSAVPMLSNQINIQNSFPDGSLVPMLSNQHQSQNSASGNKSTDSNGVSHSSATNGKHLPNEARQRTISQTVSEYQTRHVFDSVNPSGENVTPKKDSQYSDDTRRVSGGGQNSKENGTLTNESKHSKNTRKDESVITDCNLGPNNSSNSGRLTISSQADQDSGDSSSVVEKLSQPRRLGTFFEGSLDRRRDSTTPRYRGDPALTSEMEQNREIFAGKHQFRVKLYRGSRGFGFSIKGGKEFARMPISILNVALGEAADRDGQLKKDDQLMEINGYSTVDMTHTRASELIRDSSSPIELLLYRAPLQQQMSTN